MSAPPCSRVRRPWIVFAAWAAVGVCAPEETRAQGMGTMLDRPARLDVRDVPLEKALVLLQRASGVALAYSPDLVPDERRVSCPCKEMTVSQALDRLLKGTGLQYLLGEDNVVIGRWKPGSEEATRGPSAPTGSRRRPSPTAPESR